MNTLLFIVLNALAKMMDEDFDLSDEFLNELYSLLQNWEKENIKNQKEMKQKLERTLIFISNSVNVCFSFAEMNDLDSGKRMFIISMAQKWEDIIDR